MQTAYYLESFAFVLIQDSISEVRNHTRKALPERDLWLPVEQLLCLANVGFSFVGIISCVWFELNSCTRVDCFFYNLYTRQGINCTYKK